MTSNQASRARVGDEVVVRIGARPIRCMIMGVDTRGIAAPYFRLIPLDDVSEPVDQSVRGGRISHQLCTVAEVSQIALI